MALLINHGMLNMTQCSERPIPVRFIFAAAYDMYLCHAMSHLLIESWWYGGTGL